LRLRSRARWRGGAARATEEAARRPVSTRPAQEHDNMLQRYLHTSSEKLVEAINLGVAELMSLKQNQLSPEILLLGLLEQSDSIVLKVAEKLGLDARVTREKLLAGIEERENVSVQGPPVGGQIYATPEVIQTFEKAKELSQAQGDLYTGVDMFFLALCHRDSGRTSQLLEQAGFQLSEVERVLKEMRGDRKLRDREGESQGQVLAQFTTDLTQRARDGELDPVVGRDHEINQVIEILSRRRKNNPVLVGEPGVGKTVVVEGLAQRIAEADVPETLLNKRILSLEMGELVAGAKFRGEFEDRIKSVRDEIIAAGGNIILFIDELHTVVGAGEGGGGVGAANMLKPALARGLLRCIGATTGGEYKRFIESDPALERRFQTVIVPEPTVPQAIAMLQALKPQYEAHHHVHISDEAIESAAEFADRYVADRFLPDKAVDLLDTSAARKHIQAVSIPPEIRELEKQRQVIEKDKWDAFRRQDYEAAARAQIELARIASEIEKVRAGSGLPSPAQEPVVDEQDIAEVVSRATGIPVARMIETEVEKLKRMEDELHGRVVGQEAAVHALSNAIRRNRVGLKDPRRPIGVFLFLGPTGVGKTELAKALAELLLDDENKIIRLDMSEYMERHEASKMIGAPPGYIGYGEGGQLTEAVRRQPYSVVLLDEIEKAHPDVFNMLLQIFDEGRLTDAQGRTVSFKNTVIIGTSNLGSDLLSEAKSRLGFGVRTTFDNDYEKVKGLVMTEVRRAMRPEFLNRIDDIVVFHRLEPAHLRQIVELAIGRLAARLREEHDIDLHLSDRAMEKLARDGYDPAYGARPLKREIERQIENSIATGLVNGQFRRGDRIEADVQGEEIVVNVAQPAASAAAQGSA
jgi:ATP-dependent Clp protease ATP-binding subunit ClpC